MYTLIIYEMWVAGYVYICVRKQFKDHASTFETGTQTTVDYEIFTVLVS